MNDLIERQAAIDAIEEVDWYHQNKNKEMISGANSTEHQAWYKADDIYKTLEALPTEEAIPVAFIEEQMRNHYERAHNSALAIQQRNYDRAIALADLINDWHDWYDIWEKENETR